MTLKINSVTVKTNLDDLTLEEARNYIRYVEDNKNCDDPLEEIEIKSCDDGKIDVDYMLHGQKFERIRRITG